MRFARQAMFSPLSAALVATVCCLCCAPPQEYLTHEYVYPLEREVAEINRVAYPSESYIVLPGDTLSGIARRLGVDLEVLAEVNGFEGNATLKSGDLLVVPRVGGARAAADPLATGPVVAPGAPAEPSGVTLVGPSGDVRALSTGTVIGVFRKYTSLGDVVIIETDRGRVVYSGAFEPRVLKGAEVRAGDVIGSGAAPGAVKARFFDKR